ncbi:dynein gamma chain, flagellar outer arm isoform X2 [Xenopus tropicalis]|uniref:Dynein gamma chain, flagellar outer arm isoform X2 n=1 Tax=Xenopus tropicalis TaxID=8364 RepID=A0A8J1JLI9_XENTR|nr:dynein gamma chain, flagellar outer arm isoform X2 [Xenopus tropicalis]
MDERHWWIAGKVQETFQIGGQEDASTALESFFLQAENLPLINKFLQAGGIQALFFFAETKDESNESRWKLHLLADLQRMENMTGKMSFFTILFFLRAEANHDVDCTQMEREIFCGEIKDNPVQSLRCLLNDLYIPVLRAQKNWGSCNPESVTHFLSGLEKYVAAIEEATSITTTDKHQILRRPQHSMSIDFLQQRPSTVDSELLNENEALVFDWIKTIEQILMEAVDERVLDIASTPLTELEHWHQRQRILELLTEQLRGKEYKNAIGLLISSKSRLLKKWKAVDISITDAANTTKARVKYLEALSRHLETLATENDPYILINNILPAFFSGLQQIETMTRFFARNGFLGLLLTKVSNQLTQNCISFLRECIINRDSEDKLWDKIREYMKAGLLVGTKEEKNMKKDKHKEEMKNTGSSFYERMQACLTVKNYFKEEMYNLREWLQGAHGMQRYSSSSSISTLPGKHSSSLSMKTNKAMIKKPPSVTSSYDQQHEYQSTGVHITDDDTIMYHLESLCIRLKQMCDIMDKLQEFKILSRETEDLRKPAQEDIIEDDESESGSVCEMSVHGELKVSDTKLEQTPQQEQIVKQNIGSAGKLQTLIEEDEAQIFTEDSSAVTSQHMNEQDILISDNDLPNVKGSEQSTHWENNTETVLSNDEKRMLANLYNWDDDEEEESTLSSILLEKLEEIIDMLSQYIDTDVFLDTERTDQNPCEEGYCEFLVMNQQTEKYISVYIQALFLRKISTEEALAILERFSIVSHRPGIQHTINECYMDVFDWFYEELKETQQGYETFKDDPVVSRNMPPVVGAISWSRKLLSKIENSMKVFRNVRIINKCITYSETVKLYNRIASALVAYEELWYQKWKAQVDKGLSSLSCPLLIRDPITHQLLVNTDMRIIHLIEETKWMLRFGIPVPDAALVAFQQSEKFKMYKSDLQDVVQEYAKIQKKIPQNLAKLFTCHLERVNNQFQPGLSTVSWRCVNIEGLLHQTNAAVKRLQAIVERVTSIKEKVIEKTLEDIQHFDLLCVEDMTKAPMSPEEFVQQMEQCLMKKKTILKVMVSTIKCAFEDVIRELSDLQESKEPMQEKKANVTPNNRFKKPTNKQRSIPSSSDKCDYAEGINSQVLETLCYQTCQAIYTCVCRTLIRLAQLVGSDSEKMSRDLQNMLKKVTKDNTTALGYPLTIHNQGQKIRFKLQLTIRIPHIAIDPPVDSVQEALSQALSSILNIGDSLNWWCGAKKGESFSVSICEDEPLQNIKSLIVSSVNDLKPAIKKQIFNLSTYNFLWVDDMYKQSKELLEGDPGLYIIHKEVKRFLDFEQTIKEYSEVLELGCICLNYSLIKETLKGLTGSWKSHYAAILHQHAKKNLQSVVEHRETVWKQLTEPVQSLEELNSCLSLLEDLQDMENKIDDLYQPIEMMYEKLETYQLRIPREEIHNVTNLRNKWTELMNLTYIVKETLLREKQDVFKQELDKQVKSFVVEVIQFRNSFDTQGPAAPGVKPEEAVARLHNFKEKYQEYDAKRKTLNSVQKLFNIVPKLFPELDRTGKDLQLLGTLYILFQKFISFDQRFRDTLWGEVDLTLCNQEIEQYWSECLIWNEKLKDWDAYNEMAREIKFYEDIFPLLHELKSKEIRNRHWLQVMSITGSSFPLEANVFKVYHLLDIGLLKFKDQLISIAKAARKEMELEIKMRKVEEEWTEQVLSFKPYKNRGCIFLVKEDSLILLEELEDAHVLLAQMLESKEIDPLREEATIWAEKLKRVHDVLDLWTEVQELWQHLEEIFSNSAIIKELPVEARRFLKVDRSWTLMMRSAYKIKNVLQCCCTGDVPKEVLLRHIYQELEICFCSLNSYLGRMRQTFSRFYFMSDLALVSVLSRPSDIKYLQHHLRSLFGGVSSIGVEELEDEESENPEEEQVEFSGPIPDYFSVRSGKEGWLSVRSTTHVTDTESIFQRSLKSGGVSSERNPAIQYKEPKKLINAVAVTAAEGETLQLNEQIAIGSGIGVWLSKLQSALCISLNDKISQVVDDINKGMTIEEWTEKYPTQIAVLGLFYLWTWDCESTITEMKLDRKALSRALKKYSGMVGRLSSVTTKGHWKNTEEPISHCERIKLENMIMQALYFRDVMENITSHKICDISDFDWKRTARFYLKEKDGKLKSEIHILDAQYGYGCEFYGAKIPMIMNPTTEKCFLKISQILQQINGVVLTGDRGVGKTETIKGLSYLLGNFLFLFSCSPTSEMQVLRRVLNGAVLDGCWCCFDDFQLLPKIAVSVVMNGAQTLYDSLKARLSTTTLQDEFKITADRNCNLFLTVSWNAGFQNLSSEVRALFRAVSLASPDITFILRAKLTSLGFKSPKALATRLQLVSELVKEQLAENYLHCFTLQSMIEVILRAYQRRESQKDGNSQLSNSEPEGGKVSRSSSATSYQQLAPYITSSATTFKTSNSSDKKKKSVSSNPALAAAKESHVLVADALNDVVGPRMTGSNFLVFKQIVGDVFMGMYDPQGARQISQKELERAIAVKAEENQLFPHSPWLNKVKQFYNLSLVVPGIIVAGPPASGKSSCIRALVQALNHLQVSPEEPTHKLVKINPLSVDQSNLMFGSQNTSGIWEDGIVTYVWKRAIRSRNNTWLWFDGQLSSSWCDNFNSVLGPEKELHLSNGDHLEVPDNLKLIFETTDLQLASPATLTKAGILYIEGEALGWKPLSKVWLDGRNQQENAVLSKAFYKTLDPIFNYILHDATPVVPVTEVCLFRTCTNLLAVMLNDKAQSIGGQLHIERLFIFCLIWSVGALIDRTERKKFSDLLKVYTSVLPDDDHEISVFDYYLDESGEWDTWQSRLPEMTYIGSTDIMGEVFVETQDTMIIRTFLEYARMGSQHVLLTGPPGCGKTALINDFISTQDRAHTVLKRMVFSGSSKAKELQDLLEENIVHRQGFVYGAKDGKSLKIFIDDMSLPAPDENGMQRCNELLRMLLDDNVLVRLRKPFEWQCLEGIIVKAAMSLPKYENSIQRTFCQRLLRHFAIFHLPELEGSQLQQVIFSVLEANMGDKDGLPLQEELQLSIAKASCHLLESIKKVLVSSSTQGRQHYLFSIREINRTYQALRRLSNEDREDHITVVSYWKHEMCRVVQDRICRQIDLNWFKYELSNTIAKYFPDISTSAPEKLFVTFPLEMTFSNQISTGNRGVKVMLQPVGNLDDVRRYLQTIVQHYNEELGRQKLHIELSDNVVISIIRMHRVLSYEHGGNVMLVGAVGSRLSTLVKMALYVADIPLHALDTSSHSNFINSLKSAIHTSAVEGKPTAILLTAQELDIESYVGAINSLLICGEYAPLFSSEEMNDLLQVLGPALRRKRPHLSPDPAKYLVSQVKSLLRIIVCLPPNHSLLRTAIKKFPGFVNGCQMIWVDTWSQEAIHREAKHYIVQHGIMESHTDNMKESVALSLTLIHRYMLEENGQIPWVQGSSHSLIPTPMDEVEERSDSNFPYCKEIIEERMSILSPGKNSVTDKVFIGPNTLKIFLDNFKFLFIKKKEEMDKDISQLKGALKTLDETRTEARETQVTLKVIGKDYEEAQATVADVLNKLITKTSILERLKAELGVGDKNLQIFLSQNDSDVDVLQEDDALLKDDTLDEYDEVFIRMKEASKKSHLNDILQKIEKAQNDLDDVRNSLKVTKSQVMHWCNKVDKACIERLVRCQNPPYLVAQILEMALVMVDCLPKNENMNDLPRSPMHSYEKVASRGSSRFQPSPFGKSLPRKGTRDAMDKVDRARWKTLQYHVGDSSKFVDLIHQIAKLEDGLPDKALKDVEMYLGRAREGSHGITGEGSLLENASPHATPQSITPAKKYSHPDNSKIKEAKRGGITIAAARYSSEDAATLVAFIVAIVEFTRLCVPLKECLKTLSDLEREKDELSLKEETISLVATKNTEEELPVVHGQTLGTLTEDDFPSLQAEVAQLHEQYDLAVGHKYQLGVELNSQQERLWAALDILERLKIKEKEWRKKVEECNITDLLTNCVLAAAFLTYCPALSYSSRMRVRGLLSKFCERCGLPMPQRMLLNDFSIMHFLQTPIEIKALEARGLLVDSLALDNSCILSNTKGNNAWVLVCDPTGQAVEWIRGHLQEASIEVMYHDLISELDTCLTDGQTLLLTYCDVQALPHDLRFMQLLHSKREFQQHKVPFKMTIAEHEVECHPSFQIYLHTTSMPDEIPAEVASSCTTLYFYQDQEGLVEELLDRFVQQEKPRLREEHLHLKQECLESMVTLSSLEGKILSSLQNDSSLLRSISVTKKLGDLKMHHEEATEMYLKNLASERNLLHAREGFRNIALRGAVMFETARKLQQLNRMYDFSFSQLMALYDISVAHSERYSIKGVIACVTSNIFSYISKSLLEKDRMVYALLVAFEVESSLGRVQPGEREFIMSPELCHMELQRLGNKVSETRQQAKSPFDWMTEEQFKNLQILALHFVWFGDLFDRMYKDGKDLTWKTFCENDQPENPSKVKWPEGLEDLNPLQRFLVLRAVRMDRFLPAASNYISGILGKMYTAELVVDLRMTLAQMSHLEPGLLIYDIDSNLPRTLLLDFAKRMNQTVTIFPISQAEEKAEEIINHGMSEGHWVLLENVQNSVKLMASLEGILKSKKNPNKHFRLWISVQASQALPVRLLHYTVKIVVSAPMNIRGGLVHSWQFVGQEALSVSRRPEWPALLHNLCFFHCAARLRTLYGTSAGWNCPRIMRFGCTELMESLQLLQNEFNEEFDTSGQVPPWATIRYLLSEVIYGCSVSDEFDKTILTSMIDYWISSTTTKKDYELTKLKYKIPPNFFNSDFNLISLAQALDSIPMYFLDAPEAFHMHPSPAVTFGEEHYVISKLNQLHEAVSWHKEWSYSNANIQRIIYPDANPDSVQNQPFLGTVQEAWNSSSGTFMKSGRLSELYEICVSLLSKVPKGWSRDFIHERLKKLGGETPFNLFLKKELDHLLLSLTEIRRNLQMIKDCLESPEILGDQLPETAITIVDDLYHKRAPTYWWKLAWNFPCPSDWSLSSWIHDLQQRAAHFEKLLQLGREKMPTYWLGAFQNPKGLLSVLKQEAIRRYSGRSGCIEPIRFKTELTLRDKDHIRDPPQDGMFIYGLHIWGVLWNKTDLEVVDSPPRQTLNTWPVIYLQCLPISEKPGIGDTSRALETYNCPVYFSSTYVSEPIFHLDMHKENVASSRWALRGMKATIHPF